MFKTLTQIGGLFLCCLIAISGFSQKSELTSYHENGNVESSGLYDHTNEIYLGKWNYYYPNGQVHYQLRFNKSGKRQGKYTSYFQNGTIKETCRFKRGVKHGRERIYYENGNLKASGKYINGLRDGKWTTYTENGEIDRICYFEMGKEI